MDVSRRFALKALAAIPLSVPSSTRVAPSLFEPVSLELWLLERSCGQVPVQLISSLRSIVSGSPQPQGTQFC